MDIYTTEEQQVAALKKWMRENGLSALLGVVVAILIMVGWRYYQTEQKVDAANASLAYDQLLKNLQQTMTSDDVDAQGAFEASAQLLAEDYASTQYGVYGHLMLARSAADAKDYAKTQQELVLALAANSQPDMEAIIKLRLARIQLALQELDKALVTLAGIMPAAFVASQEELKGDVYLQQGNKPSALTAYQAAQAAVDDEGTPRPLLKMKLDNLAD